MAVLPMPCSCSLNIHLHTNIKNNNTVCLAGSLATESTSRTAAEPRTSPFHGISLRTRPRTLVVDQEDGRLMKTIKIEDEGYLEKEAANVIMRLKTAVERLRDVEIQKFLSRVSHNDSSVMAAEEMSGHIVSEFLEKPIEYLTSDAGCNLEQKLKDVDVLVSILENSCLRQAVAANQR
ncbi:hypothetical protein AB3S75_021998 [Citrus x aurantiifolia]